MQITITPNSGPPVTLINGNVDTGYRLLPETEWGNTVWDPAYSGQRGTQGARAAGSTPQNRPVVLALRVYGTSQDNLHDRLGVLYAAGDDLRRYAGRITTKMNQQTYRQHFDVLGGSARLTEWRKRAESMLMVPVMFEAACAPYLLGDPYDIADEFLTDSLAAGDYTFDAAASSDWSFAVGRLAPLTSTVAIGVERRITHTTRGLTVLGSQATVKTVVGTVQNGYKAGVTLRRSAATTYLDVYVDDDGANSRLRIDKVIAGARTNLASTNLGGRVPISRPFWVRGRIEGNVVIAEHFASTTPPTPMGAPTTTTTYTLTAAEQTSLPAGVGGLSWIPAQSSAYIDSYVSEPFTRRNATLPEIMPLEATIPGDAPALCDVTVTPSGGAAAPVWAQLAFLERPAAHNLCWNGDLEVNVNGWAIAAVTGVQAAAGTSVARDTVFPYVGAGALQLVTPATTGAGCNFPIYRRFRKGQTYTATVFAAGTPTSMSLKLGVNGDVATFTQALTAGTYAVWTVTWTPTADREVAYLSFQTNAAAATTCTIDAAVVYDGATAPTIGRHAEGAGAVPPFGVLDAEASDPGDLTGWVIAADAGSRLGTRLYDSAVAGAETYTAGWWIDPALLVADDFTMGEIDIDIMGVAIVHASNVSPKLTLSARPEWGTAFGSERFTGEWGTSGVLLTKPSAGSARRPVRLGTITLPVDRSRPARWKLWVAGSTAAGSAGDFGLDYLWLAPVRGRAAQITRKANDSTYPRFVQSTAETSKLITSDLRGATSKPPNPFVPDHGIGQALLELPAPDVDLLVKLSSLVPDDPTSDATTEQLAHSATIHAAVTPRWHLFRGAS